MSRLSRQYPLFRIGLAVVAVVALTALSLPTNFQRRGPESPPTYTFVDARPADQMKSKIESLMIPSCAYGIWRIGDKDFTPGLAAILNDRLMTALAEPLRGRTVRLVNFTVHMNGSIAARQSASNFAGTQGALGGLIDEVMNKHSVTGYAADDLRGGFTKSELPEGTLSRAPWVVVVDVEVDGRLFHARHVQPSDPGMGMQKGANRQETKALRQAARDVDVGRAIDGALDKLLAMLAAEQTGQLQQAEQTEQAKSTEPVAAPTETRPPSTP